MLVLPMREQADYVILGLPPCVASLLSSQNVPLTEIAAVVLALLKEKELEKMKLLHEKDVVLLEKAQLVLEAKKKEALQEHITRRCMQLRGQWNARGILGAGQPPTLHHG